MDDVTADIVSQLRKYENDQGGKMTVIHGDPVLTNILFNQTDDVKFIDMRGNQGNMLSILGDHMYDWAKLYQSLIGYDEIVDDVKVDEKYKLGLIMHFKSVFINMFDDSSFETLKLITKSLLLSLLFLHHNDKCEFYYGLISCSYLN
jgi:hypothetical protein